MPLDFGVGELLRDEYERFTKGLDTLSDGGQRAARAAAARIRPSDPAVRTITVPGWDDVVHLTPRPTITPEMREAHYAARRRGAASPLDPILVEEINRRAQRAQSIRTSTTPEYAKAYGQVMTAIDNVQDLLTTVTTTGRFALQGGARLIDALAPGGTLLQQEAARAGAARVALAEFAAREAAGEFVTRAAAREAAVLAGERAALRVGLGLGARTIGRLVPILGPILLAADILKLLTYLGLLMFPAYAAMCAGVGAGLSAAALPAAQAMLGKRAGKRKVGQLGKLNPFSMKARLDRSNTLRSWRPSIYNLMEVAQTTDALFGVGVSFGGLVGLVSEAAFSTEAARRGQLVRVDTSAAVQSFHRAWQQELKQVGDAELTDLRAAAGVLAHAPALDRVQEVFTLQEHLDFLAAQCAAWSILRPWIASPQMDDAANAALDHWWAPPAPMYAETRAILAAELGEAAGFARWPLYGAPDRIRGDALLGAAVAEIPTALRQLIDNHPEEPATALVGAFVSQITDRAGILMTGSADGFALAWEPAWSLTEALAFAGRVPVIGADEGPVLAFWQQALDLQERTGSKLLPAEAFDALAAQAGVVLARVDAP